ncbi:hypothetical protein EG329_006108 [Mollisiaceae sp. DMI_Dod_QoI]|nr:hypothetical protein EG329_006108 [Helotiales sp. DMI_Dod_QoI]
MTSNPLGFLSVELWANAKFALIIALAVWCMALAGVTPPGTLAVVPGHFNSSTLTSLPSFNWSSPNWIHISNMTPFPAPKVLTLAMQAAESMQIVPISPPSTNTSYSLRFYGPALQCEQANDTQIPIFQYYSSALSNGGEMIMTQSTFETNDTNGINLYGIDALPYPFMLQFSAFAPMLPERNENLGILADASRLNDGDFDQFNDWNMDIQADFNTSYLTNPTTGITPLQLWVQTANQSFVCTLMNSSYEVDFEYVLGDQKVTPSNVTYLEPLYVGSDVESLMFDSLDHYAYLAVFVSMTNMLSGNVTTTISDIQRDSFGGADLRGTGYNTTRLYDSSSRILLTGLMACEDFTKNFWTDNPISYYDGFNNTIYPVFSNESNMWDDYSFQNLTHNNYTNKLFTQPAWMCRNRTLMRAIEDLSYNITISMLSSEELTTPNTTTANVTYFPTHNMYQYNNFKLISPYSIATFATLLGVAVGLYSFRINGVSHSTAFSAVVATTRNPGLDIINDSENKEIGNLKLKFGAIATDSEVLGRNGSMNSGVSKRLAFGLEDDIQHITE